MISLSHLICLVIPRFFLFSYHSIKTILLF